MRPPLSPADVIEMVRQRRGETPGPPSDQYLPSRAVDPEGQPFEDDNGFMERFPTPVELEPESPPPTTFLDLERGKGHYEGYAVQLTEEELAQVRACVAGAVVRQLMEQVEKLSGQMPKPKSLGRRRRDPAG